MIKHLLTALLCIISLCTYAEGPEMGVAYKVTTQTWGTDWAPKKIPAIAFNSDAQSVKIKVVNAYYAAINNGNGKEGSQNGDIYVISYNTINASGMTFNISNSEYLATAKAGNLYLRIGGGENYEIYVTNYATADGAANDTGNTSGGNTGGGNTGGQGDNVDPTSMAYKIAHKQQLTNVPTIYLTVPDAQGKELKTVLYKDRTTNTAEYHTATIQVVDNSEVGSPQHLESFTDYVQIKVRGNSTADPDKKPYRLKFAKEIKDADGTVIANCQKHDLLGQGYSKRNWALMANYFDRSMIRNALTYHLGKYLGLEFCPGYKFVDVVINGDYRGTYQITDHVEAGTDRVNIDEDNDWMIETVSWDNMLDTDYGIKASTASSTNSNITIPYNTNVKNPEPADDVAWAKLKDDVITWEREWNTSFQNSSKTTGWQAYNDVESFIKYYLAMNITDDYDGFFVMKGYRKPDGPFFWGPIWDKDLAYGNCSYTPSDPHLTEEIDNGLFRWNFINFLHNDCTFMSRVKYTLDKLIADGICEKLCKDVDDLTELIDETKTLNYSTWPLTTDCGIGVYTYSDYSQHATQLKTFLRNRFDYLKDRIHTMCSDLGCEDYVEEEPDDTPTGDLGALVDLGDGKYSYTGSASTFKEGTEITITTSEGTTLSNYITEGTAWNTNKTITLTADDVTTLAANSYTFFMNATGGEVKAVNVKVPVVAGTGLSDGTQTSYSIVYTYVGDKNSMAEGATFNITLEGTNPYYKAFISDENSPLWYAWGAGAGPKNYSYTINADQAKALADNKYKINISVYEGTCSSASFIGTSSGGSDTPTTPTYALTLSASEGGTVTGAGTYAEGTTVLIKAIPNDGYKFVKWSDDNTYVSRSVTLKEAITLSATFAAEGSADEDPFNEQGTRKQLTDLPTIYLNADNINGEWLQAAVEVFDKDNKLYQGATWKKEGLSKKGNINVSVQYQGSGADNSKNSYRLKFNDKINLLSATGLYKQWVLLANDDDPTMLNNALAKELGDAIGMPWTPGYRFVDLYVNDKYMGTYQLTDRVKAEDGRSLVSGGNKDLDWQVRFNDQSELDEDGTEHYVPTVTNAPYVILRNPDPKDITTPEELTALKKSISQYFTNFFGNNYANVEANVDKDQLINWYICQEILGVYKGFSSIEAYRSITTTAADNKVHFGPLWDSEKGFGNIGEALKDIATEMGDLNTEGSHKGLMIEYAAYDGMKQFFQYLWTQDWFKSGVKTKWDAIHTSLPTTLSETITTLKGAIADSQALNAQKWDNSLGSYDSYEEALAATNAYITNRFAYLDKKFTELAGAAHVHSYTAYIDNGDGTHSRKCSADDAVEEGCELHTLKTNNDLKAHCAVCGYTSTDAIDGAQANEDVYAIKEYKKNNTSYITATSNFTPAANTFYETATALPEEVNKANVIWKRADGDYVANSVVITDGTAYSFDTKIHSKKAVYSRTTGTSMWGTMCIPFKIAQSTDDYDIYQLDALTINKAQGTATLTFSPATKTSGELPLVYKRKENIASLTFNGVPQEYDGTNAEDVGFVTVKKSKKIGHEDLMNASGEWTLYGNVKTTTKIDVVSETSAYYKKQVYYFSGDKFIHCTGTVNVTPFRAFYVSTQDLSGIQNAKSFGIAIADEEETTDINDVSIEDVLAIFIEQGGVAINAAKATDINIYGMNGSKLSGLSLKDGETRHISLAPGMYVINNKKIIIR